MIGGKAQVVDFGGVPKTAVGHDSRTSPHLQAGDQYRASRGSARVFAGINHHHAPHGAALDSVALGVLRVLEYGDGIEILSGGNVPKRKRLAHHIGELVIDRAHVLYELVSQAPFKEGSAKCCSADVL